MIRDCNSGRRLCFPLLLATNDDVEIFPIKSNVMPTTLVLPFGIPYFTTPYENEPAPLFTPEIRFAETGPNVVELKLFSVSDNPPAVVKAKPPELALAWIE